MCIHIDICTYIHIYLYIHCIDKCIYLDKATCESVISNQTCKCNHIASLLSQGLIEWVSKQVQYYISITPNALIALRIKQNNRWYSKIWYHNKQMYIVSFVLQAVDSNKVERNIDHSFIRYISDQYHHCIHGWVCHNTARSASGRKGSQDTRRNHFQTKHCFAGYHSRSAQEALPCWVPYCSSEVLRWPRCYDDRSTPMSHQNVVTAGSQWHWPADPACQLNEC